MPVLLFLLHADERERYINTFVARFGYNRDNRLIAPVTLRCSPICTRVGGEREDVALRRGDFLPTPRDVKNDAVTLISCARYRIRVALMSPYRREVVHLSTYLPTYIPPFFLCPHERVGFPETATSTRRSNRHSPSPPPFLSRSLFHPHLPPSQLTWPNSARDYMSRGPRRYRRRRRRRRGTTRTLRFSVSVSARFLIARSRKAIVKSDGTSTCLLFLCCRCVISRCDTASVARSVAINRFPSRSTSRNKARLLAQIIIYQREVDLFIRVYRLCIISP